MPSKSRFPFATTSPTKKLLPALGSCCFLLAPLTVLSVCASSAMMAQVSGGSLSGRVTDPSGAIVAGAKVTVTNRATNISKSLVTSSEGLFNAPNIEPAVYDVVIDQPGFSQQHLTVTVEIARDSLLNVQLSVGAETQTVQVETSAAAVDLGTTSLNQTVDGKTLRELPLNGRDFTSLAVLEPNVHTVDNQLSISAGDNTRSNRGVGTQISIGGTRPQQNNYRLDGMTTNDYSGAGPGGSLGGTLGVDAVQEFSVITSNGTADYGRSSGGFISAVTRGGGNKFHGSAYEFIRNSALDARNYFSNNTAPFKRNQFGGTVAGPIKKDRAFFFFNYEGLRQSRSTATTDTVPTAQARTGLLRCVQAASGAKQNASCLTGPGGTVAPAGTVGQQQYTVAPEIVPFLALFPLPNQPAASGINDTGSWVFDSTAVAKENLYTGRVDYTFSPRDSIHFTGLNDTSNDFQPDGYNFVQTGLNVERKLYSLNEQHIFNPNLINFARAGYSYTFSIAPASSTAISPLATDNSLGFVPNNNVGEIQITGLSTFFGGVNAEGTYSFHYHDYQAGDDLYLTKGKHALQAGFSFDAIQSNDKGNVTNGFYTFGSLLSFLTDAPTQFTSNIPGGAQPINLREKIYGAYVQDAWRVRPNLTLSLGVRYEPTSTVSEPAGRLASLTALNSGTLHVGGSYYNNPSLRNIAPRVGVAWDPYGNGKTSIRAAYGLYDTLISTYMFTLGSLGVQPFGNSLSVNTATTPLAGTFPNKTYVNALAAINAAGNTSLVGKKVSYVDQNPGRPYLQQFLFNVQQELIKNTTLELGYVGSHGVRQPLHANDGNTVQPLNPTDLKNLVWPNLTCTTPLNKATTCVTTGKVINPNVGGIDTVLFNESTLYDALNASLRHSTRNSRLGISYTWSKSIDESSSSNGGTNFTNSIISPYPTVIGRFRGLSDFNVAHNLVVNGLYTVALKEGGNALLRGVANGLQAGGIVRFATGLPFTPLISGDQLGLSNNNPLSFPDRIYSGPGCSGNPVNLADKNNYLLRQCFAFPNGSPAISNTTSATPIVTTYVPRLGNLQRNSIIGPGITTVDMSLVKNFLFPRISDTSRIEFRAEGFNVLNHPNFTVPSRTASVVFNQTGGPVSSPVLTQTSTNERQLQFGLKLIF